MHEIDYGLFYETNKPFSLNGMDSYVMSDEYVIYRNRLIPPNTNQITLVSYYWNFYPLEITSIYEAQFVDWRKYNVIKRFNKK